MKKIWLLTTCCSLMVAEMLGEGSSSLETLETLSDEIVIPPTSPLQSDSTDYLEEDLSNKKVELPPPTLVENEVENEIFVPFEPTSAPNSPLTLPSITQPLETKSEANVTSVVKKSQETEEKSKPTGITIDLGQVFAGSPTIYSVLLLLSIVTVGIWIYALLSLRNSQLLPTEVCKELRNQLDARSYETALSTCKNHPSLLFGMVATAIKNKHQGSATMLEMMKAEGRRLSISYWQKINLLNDIAIIAPMLGLLGTVLGMFYAFYDLNRSAESISALFDGLGISVGTTVAGLVVAMLALTFHAMTKYLLMQQLTLIEAQAEEIVQTIKE